MRLKVFAIRDSALDAYIRPFFVPSVAMAARSFRDEVNRPESEMHRHPSDYELFELGEWDEESGQFAQNAVARSVVRAVDCKEDVK